MNRIQELLPDLKKVSLDDFYREINHVQGSLIRTEADEVTYGLHIIIRYENRAGNLPRPCTGK